MRKFLHQFLPHHEAVEHYRWLKPFGRYLHEPNLWHLHRRSVAGGVAIGLFCGLIPGPLQMISATLLAVLFRVNLSVALFTTLYTNPFTIVPLYMLAYRFGAWLSGTKSVLSNAHMAMPQLHWDAWGSELWGWLAQLGHPLLIGLPMLAISLAITGYLLVRVLWRVTVLLRWRARKHMRLEKTSIS